MRKLETRRVDPVVCPKSAGEAMLLDGEPVAPADDLRQARELAMLICSSEEAIETFIAHCDVAARDLLLPMAMW